MRPYFLRASLVVLLIAALSGTAAAQVGRVGGVVKDDSGQPIQGATVIAENSNLGPNTFTATTDDKGRFTMIGLRSGRWRFIAHAPGHAANAGEMPVRFGTPNPPLTFVLRRNGPGPASALGSITAKDLQTQLAAADALFNQEQWDDAVAAYRAIMAKTPALSVINLQIAAAYRNKKDYEAAMAAYNALLSVDPGNEKATIGISATLLDSGDVEAAEATLRKAAEAATAGREVFYHLGEVTFAKGDLEQAAVWYERAGRLDPSWGKPLYKLGLIALKKDDSGGAAQFMNNVLAVDPISPEAALAKAALDQLTK